MKAQILVIEDDPAALDLVAYLLRSAGHTVVTARTAEEAWASLQAAGQAARPDLILCDLMLPKASGFELAQWLKADAVLQATPAVALSVLTSWNHRSRAIAAGFNGYLEKPITAATFAAEVEGLVQRLGPPPAAH